MNLKSIRKYFWDINIAKLDIRKYKGYIIERILEMGDEEAIYWLKKNFSREDILQTIQKSRRISHPSLNYWNLILGKK